MIHPLILSKFDTKGGAAIAAHRLHEGLKQEMVYSTMLVDIRSSQNDQSILGDDAGHNFTKARNKVYSVVNSFPLRFTRKPVSEYSLQWISNFEILTKINKLKPDIINLHWICAGFIGLKTIARFNVPVVWTIHDMWPFTGGCHYSHGCNKFMKNCGNCPQLGSKRDFDFSRWLWNKKASAWEDLDMTFVSPSKWLAKEAQSSGLFRKLRVEVIPNGINTDIYKPLDRQKTRQILNLPANKTLILFGAVNATSNPRKGFHLLKQALKELTKLRLQDVEIVVYGASSSNKESEFGIKCHYLGELNSDLAIVQALSAADVFVAPSVQDNLPNTIMEAISCGIPCVAFDIGGISDMIEHTKNGYLATPFDVQEFARGVLWIVENTERFHQLSNYARQKAVNEFNQQLQAKRYLSLFHELI